VRDLEDLVAHLGLTDFDLGGFSLGARTAARAVLDGLAPRRLVLGGMGLEGLDQWESRSRFFIDAIDNYETIERGDPHYLAQQFMKTQKVDRPAMRLLLGSVGDIDAGEIAAIAMPTLVVCGAEDHDNGSATALAEALPDAAYAGIPGTHMSSVTKREFGEAIVRFLSA
jgi:pimeloyl-ACP methyl ester carboxylesterase